MKAISIRVFKNDMYKDCSARGISERYDDLYFICDDGYIDIPDDNIRCWNTVVFARRTMAGKECGYLRPYHKPEDEVPFYSFCGAYAATSDDRFNKVTQIYGAVPIHDRVEF